MEGADRGSSTGQRWEGSRLRRQRRTEAWALKKLQGRPDLHCLIQQKPSNIRTDTAITSATNSQESSWENLGGQSGVRSKGECREKVSYITNLLNSTCILCIFSMHIVFHNKKC